MYAHAMQAFMVVVWIAVELLFLFLFFSLPAIAEVPPPGTDKGPSPIHHTINSPPSEGTLLLPESKTTSSSRSPKDHMKWSQRVWQLIREEPVVLLAVVFVTMFNQTGLEVGKKFCDVFCAVM